MKKILLILSLFCCTSVFGQEEASNWYFGQGAGVKFDLANGTVSSVNDGQLNTLEGCTSISDSNGDLILYTDGSTVYNKNHQVMQNGTGLYGDPSSTQSALVVPAPDDSNIYYIFTVDVDVTDDQSGTDFGFNYSIVDLTLDAGLGGITSKNINLLPICSEKITAVVKDCHAEAIWVLTYATLDGSPGNFTTYHAFEVTAVGVNPNSIVSTFPPNDLNFNDRRGSIKVSPDGTKFASANMIGGLFLFDFDTSTGTLSNQQELIISSQSPFPYGVEFSPNSELLYVHSSNGQGSLQPATLHQSSLTQFNLSAADIQASEFRVDERQLYRGSLQLGPNGKIYRSMSDNYIIGLPYLSAINNPNALGDACNYQNNAVALFPNLSTQGLPPFIQSFFNSKIDIIQNNISTTDLSLCEGETYTLAYEDVPSAIYTWYQDGVLLAESNYDLVVTAEGTYELFIEFNDGSCDTFEGIAYVSFFSVPIANQPNDISICDDDNDGISSFDFTTTVDGEVLGGQDPTEYSVHYFESQEDADNDENEILMPYLNTANPIEIFARIHNINFKDCYDTTSFFVEVFNTPTANIIGDIEVCDDALDGNDMNGQVTIDLPSLDPLVLDTQDAALYNISYHSSQVDADAGVNPLPNLYYNQTPNSEEIFVRIENILNVDCYDTSTFFLIVHILPEKFNATLFQCDEDGITDGFTLFNLTEANDDLTGGIANRSTRFYLTLADAQNSSNEIDGNSFSNSQNPQTIQVQVIDDATGCFSLAELTLEVSTTNAYNAALSVCDDDGIEDGLHLFDLNQADADVLNGLPTDLDISYYETYENALLEQMPLSTSYTNTVAYAQTIHVRVEDDNACYGINEVQLTVFELPNIETEFETIYCLNFFPQLITLTHGIINDIPNNYTFLWSTGEITSEIQVNEPGTYTVTVTNTNGCTKLRTITVLPSNIATFENIEVIDATVNNTVTVIVSGEGDYEYALDDINGPYQDSNFFENVPAGLHTVYVRDKNNCGIVEEIVSVIGFPKYFTPNNDSYHDTWHVSGINNEAQFASKIYIFDRYGKLLKQLSPQGPGWDGTFNGQELPSSDYWFHVTLQDGRIFKSHFSLKR